MATIGEQIIEARKAKGMTQDALSKVVHVSRAAVANWEHGRRLPDAEMLLKLSEVLDYRFMGADAAENTEPHEAEFSGADRVMESEHPLPSNTPANRKRLIILCAVAMALLTGIGAFIVWRGGRTQTNAVEPAYPVEYFQSAVPNEAGKAYLRLSATTSVQEGSERQYQMYTIHMDEMNGIGYTIDTVEVCGYGNGKYHSEIYNGQDMKLGGLDPELEPYGAFEFVGGFPVGVFDGIGVIVRGKDVNGEALQFTGYVSF